MSRGYNNPKHLDQRCWHWHWCLLVSSVSRRDSMCTCRERHQSHKERKSRFALWDRVAIPDTMQVIPSPLWHAMHLIKNSELNRLCLTPVPTHHLVLGWAFNVSRPAMSSSLKQIKSSSFFLSSWQEPDEIIHIPIPLYLWNIVSYNKNLDFRVSEGSIIITKCVRFHYHDYF